MAREISLEQLAAEIPDGATIALGGAGLQRKPMAAVRGLIEAGRRELTGAHLPSCTW